MESIKSFKKCKNIQNKPMPKIDYISAVMILKNAEKSLKATLESLQLFTEVIILDNGSTDKSLEIAAEYDNVKVFHSPFIGFGPLKNLAASHASNDWIFSIDSDEIITDQLFEVIHKLDLSSSTNVYSVLRQNAYDGTVINGANWGNDWVKRLYNRKVVHFYDSQVHEVLNTEHVTVSKIRGALKHESYSNIDELLHKQGLYTTLFAEQNAYRKRISSTMIVLKTLFTFFQSYFLKRGMIYGWKGLLISYYNSSAVFYKYSKLKEFNNNLTTSLVVTTYNRPDALELVLESVLRQKRLPNEVIVADDGSTTTTKDLIDSYKDKYPIPLKHIWHEDKGFRLASIRNKALAVVSNDYVMMVDGDMVLSPSFIESHVRKAKKGWYSQGSRVRLTEVKTKRVINKKTIGFSFLSSGIINRLNAINSPILSALFSMEKKTDIGTKGCNMAFWMDDIKSVNGFNEDFKGWGREDSEFVVRMLNSKVRRNNLRFTAVAYHLYHDESSRASLEENDKILEKAIVDKIKRCDNGVDQYIKVDHVL